MNKYIRLGKNTFLVFVGNGGSKLITFIMLPFYTRWLSVEGYGVTEIISVYVTLFLGLATACVADAVFIFPKGQPVEKQRAYFSSGLVFAFFSLLLTALLFKIVTVIFSYRGLSNSFTDNSWLVYGLLIATFLQQYIQQFVRSIDKLKIYSSTGIVLVVCTALFSFIAIPHWGVSGYVFSLILANIAACLYSLLFSGAFKYFSFKKVNKNNCMEMIKFSFPLVPNAIMWWLVSALNRPLMEHHLGLYAIGIYGIASKFSGILSVLFSIFSVSWQISVMEEFGKEGYSYFYNKMFRLIVTGLVLLFFIITVSSKFIVSILTTPDFYEAWRYIPMLTFGVIFSSISGLVGSNFSAAKKSKYFLYSSIWGIGSSLICNIIFIPRFGIMGAAVSIPISLSVMAVSRILYAWKYVKIENIWHYTAMLIIGILTIFTMSYFQTFVLKFFIFISLFVLFIGINHELRKDVFKFFSLLRMTFKTNVN